MNDSEIARRINFLSKNDWDDLSGIYHNLSNHTEPLYKVIKSMRLPNGEITMPHVIENKIISTLRRFIKDKNLDVPFGWSDWIEGKALLKSAHIHQFSDINPVTALKLLLAVLYNDRFNEGAFSRLLDTDIGLLLLKRFLEFKDIGRL